MHQLGFFSAAIQPEDIGPSTGCGDETEDLYLLEGLCGAVDETRASARCPTKPIAKDPRHVQVIEEIRT